MGSLGTEISWPSKKPQERQSRIHNHHISLRDRIKELQSRTHGKHPKAEQVHGNQETTKAVAWAVFQHHGEGGVGHGHTHGMAVRRPTRFKIEAQMNQEVAHQSVYEAVAFSWGAGSTLFDSFELNSLMKTLDQAAHAHPAGMSEQNHRDEGADEAGAMVVYSPKHCSTRPQPRTPPQRHSQWSLANHGRRVEDCRLDTVDDMRPSKAHGEGQGQRAVRYNLSGNVKLNDLRKHDHGDAKDASSSVFGHWYTPNTIGRRSFDSSTHEKPAKGGAHHHHHHHHHHNRWKNLLHTLHLDGANGLFHGFHKSHTQVAPHDLEKNLEHKGRNCKFNHKDGSHGHAHLDREQYDAHFDRNDLPVSKDVHPPSDKDTDDHHHRHHPHYWKFGFMKVLTQPFCRPGHLLSDNEESDSEESHRGHKKHHGYKHADLRAAWSSLTAKLHHHHHHHELEHEHGRQRNDLQGSEQSAIEHHHHHHHHHHHVQPEGEDNEMTVQAISTRVSRNSFEEKARRLSIEDGGLKAPRNSLETQGERFRG